MKTVFYSTNSQFTLTDDEFLAFIRSLETSKHVWIPRLRVYLSNLFIWAGSAPQGMSSGRLHDGTRVIKKFGEWKDAENPEIHLDSSYYPEIVRDEILSEEEWLEKKSSNVLQKPSENDTVSLCEPKKNSS